MQLRQLVFFWSISFPQGFYIQVSGLGDNTDGAATLALHGIPPFQLPGDPPPDALQVQAPVKLPCTQGDTKKTQIQVDFYHRER